MLERRAKRADGKVDPVAGHHEADLQHAFCVERVVDVDKTWWLGRREVGGWGRVKVRRKRWYR